MPVSDFDGVTFVAFLDISGFKNRKKGSGLAMCFSRTISLSKIKGGGSIFRRHPPHPPCCL